MRGKTGGTRRVVGRILWYAMHLMVLGVGARWGVPGFVVALVVLILVRTFLRVLGGALDDLAREESALAYEQSDDEWHREASRASATWGPWQESS